MRLVDELKWLDEILTAPEPAESTQAHAVHVAAATVLERGADLIAAPAGSPEPLHAALADLQAQLGELERVATRMLPEPGDAISSLDPSFRAQELSYIVSQIASNIDLAAAAERRSWFAQLLGRRPTGLRGPLAAAQERASAHVERHSVWLQNSVRGAAGLGLAVLVADVSEVSHGFWVVLGTLSVLRSNALSTGQNVLRGLAGTVIGFAAGAAIVAIIGTNTALLWVLLPFAVLFAGLAPVAISFAAGQAAFTLVLLIIFNILAPEGWQIGLVRIEDVLLGSSVSLVVGLLLWPRGATAALGTALAEAYADSARYLAGAVQYGVSRCDHGEPSRPAPTGEAVRAAAAARRLDDTFRSYLAERGAKPAPLAEVTSLVTGVAGLRLAGDAVLELWQSDGNQPGGDRSAARRELLAESERMTGWYERLAASLAAGGTVPEPQPPDPLATDRLVDAVSRDLRDRQGEASATAVRVIWTGDHLDAARRLQTTLAPPAQAISG